jgi:hypothetical protein
MEDAATNVDSPRTARPFDCQDYLPWLIIVKALRPAISFRLLILAATGLVAMTAGWRISWDLLAESEFTSGFVSEPTEDNYRKTEWPWASQAASPTFVLATSLDHNKNRIKHRVLELQQPFVLFFEKSITWTGVAHSLLCGMWTLIVWSFFGAMITRVAALRLTIDEHASWGRMSAFARSRFSSYFGAPLFPLAGVVITAIPVFALGLFALADWGTLVTGLFWGLALIAGFFMALLLVGLMFGWPLMYATISTEGTDSFDALGRSYAYVLQRPLHYLFYIFVALISGAIGLCIVDLFAFLVIHTTEWAAGWGASHQRMQEVAGDGLDSGMGYAGSSLILFWKNIVYAIVAGFPLAYMWCAATASYLLLRRQVDAAEMDEIELDEDDERYGLPPLETDGAGVVGVAGEPEGTATSPEPTDD